MWRGSIREQSFRLIYGFPPKKNSKKTKKKKENKKLISPTYILHCYELYESLSRKLFLKLECLAPEWAIVADCWNTQKLVWPGTSWTPYSHRSEGPLGPQSAIGWGFVPGLRDSQLISNWAKLGQELKIKALYLTSQSWWVWENSWFMQNHTFTRLLFSHLWKGKIKEGW